MKISCQACAAKYTIADEKVVGKIVKIRCKKCGETISVNGNEMLDEDEPTAMFQVGTHQLWTVSFSETDQKTLSVMEMQRDFGLRKVTGDTFVWREGMADWLPLRDVQELREAIMGETGAPDFDLGAELAVDAAGFDEGAFGGETQVQDDIPTSAVNDYGADLLAMAGRTPTADPASSTAGAARRVVKRTGGDLFATNYEMSAIPSPLTTTATGGAAPLNAPAAAAQLTGQRNENSVLFSLGSLTANGGNIPGRTASASPAASANYPANEASGLIDIRALASAAGATNKAGAAKVDDIMSLGGGGAFASPLGAPMLSPVADYSASAAAPVAAGGASGNKGLKVALVGLGTALVAVLGIGGYFLTRPPAVEEKSPVVVVAPPVAPPVAPIVAPSVIDPLAAPVAPVAPVRGVAPHTGAGAASHAGAGAAAPALPVPPVVRKDPPTLQDAILGAAGGTPKPVKPVASTDSNAAFDRGAASSALNAIAANLASCKKAGDPSGVGRVAVVFGNNGYAKSATVTEGPFAGTRAGGCIAAKFRGAHIPAFGGGDVPVNKSFSVN